MYCPFCGGNLLPERPNVYMCKNCRAQVIEGIRPYRNKSWVIWRLSEEDITLCAKRLKLPKKQIEEINMEDVARLFKKGVEWNLMESWVECLEDSITESL